MPRSVKIDSIYPNYTEDTSKATFGYTFTDTHG